MDKSISDQVQDKFRANDEMRALKTTALQKLKHWYDLSIEHGADIEHHAGNGFTGNGHSTAIFPDSSFIGVKSQQNGYQANMYFGNRTPIAICTGSIVVNTEILGRGNKMDQTAVEPVAYSTVPNWITDKNFALASRAILKACEQYGRPKYYMVDISQDLVLISEHKLSKFVYLLRKHGTSLFAPLVLNGSRQAMMSSLKAYRAQHVDALWFTYDVDDIQPGDDYNQPQLRLVTAATAQQYLYMLYDELNETVI